MTLPLLIAELTTQDRNQIIIALAILLVLVILGGFGILLFRRHLKNADEADSSANVGFSLSDLRTMRDQGEITAEEYEATRAKVIAAVKASLAPKPPKKTGSDKSPDINP